jgi:hypothetical protein
MYRQIHTHLCIRHGVQTSVYEREEVQSLKKRFHMEILEQCNICIFVAQLWKKYIGSLIGRPSRSRTRKLLLHPSTLPIDVQCTLGQCKDKFNKMKDKHSVKKKKTTITSSTFKLALIWEIQLLVCWYY